jgi:16S rRNA (adenine1518-N6/adenine1519-N6)-dimethyltransferase
VPDDSLPPLREVIERFGLGAKKSLGQNFLLDFNLTRRIARAAAPLAGFTIAEVGPGPGGLTRALLMEGATHIVAIERDRRAIVALNEVAAAYPGRLTVIEGDALAIDWRGVLEAPAKIIANLPYNIATPLLIGWLTDRHGPMFASLTLMFQKEVAERIVAKPGTKDYGRLSVLCQYTCEVRKLFDVNRTAFTPPPKVTSSLVQLIPRHVREPACPIEALERVTGAGFGQRRKMLRTSLRTLAVDIDVVLSNTGIDPRLRAEQLSVSDFARLAAAIASRRSEGGQELPPGS